MHISQQGNNMTYDQLAKQIAAMTSEQQQQDVTVYVGGDDEYYPLVGDYPLVFAQGVSNDTLDPDHPYLVV
jgi:hypothetical protein